MVSYPAPSGTVCGKHGDSCLLANHIGLLIMVLTNVVEIALIFHVGHYGILVSMMELSDITPKSYRKSAGR